MRRRDGKACELIRECWAAQEGVVCRGVSWERQPLEELMDIAACVGGPGLAALCALLAEDQAGWSGTGTPPPPPRAPIWLTQAQVQLFLHISLYLWNARCLVWPCRKPWRCRLLCA